MFLRRYERKKNGKRHTYWALVESIRTGRGSRQRTVAYLGELKKSEKSGWAQLCRRMNGRARPQPSLFAPPHHDDPTDEEPALVRLKGVRLERLRDFGDVWLALGLWRLLGLDMLLADRMLAPSVRQRVDQTRGERLAAEEVRRILLAEVVQPPVGADRRHPTGQSRPPLRRMPRRAPPPRARRGWSCRRCLGEGPARSSATGIRAAIRRRAAGPG